jgi:hypothetical protein
VARRFVLQNAPSALRNATSAVCRFAAIKKPEKKYKSFLLHSAGACLRDLPPPKRFGEGWSRYGEGRRPAEG